MSEIHKCSVAKQDLNPDHSQETLLYKENKSKILFGNHSVDDQIFEEKIKLGKNSKNQQAETSSRKVEIIEWIGKVYN